MAASYESPTEYIQHHLTFMVKPVGEHELLVRERRHRRDIARPGRARTRLHVARHAQGERRRAVEDPGVHRAVLQLRQRPGQGHLPRREPVGRAHRADRVHLGHAHERDGLPARRHPGVRPRRRGAAQLAHRADRGHQHHVRARALRVRADGLLQHQESRAWAAGPRSCSRAVRQASAAVAVQLPVPAVEYCRSRCRTACACSATCTRARSSSCCSACGRRAASSARSFGGVLQSRLGDLPHPDRRCCRRTSS